MSHDHVHPTRFDRISAVAFVLALCSLACAGVGVALPRIDSQFQAPISGGFPLILSWAVCVLAIVVGPLAAWTGNRGIDAVIRSRGGLVGGGFSFFAVLIGLLAASTGAVLIYARLLAGSPF